MAPSKQVALAEHKVAIAQFRIDDHVISTTKLKNISANQRLEARLS